MTDSSIWIIRHALRHSPETDDALATCRLRGWIEQLDHAVPAPSDYADAEDDQRMLDLVEPLYRLTGAGWDVIHRRQSLIVTSTAVSAISVSMSLIGLLVTLAHFR